MERNGTGLAARPWQGGRGSFPGTFLLGAAAAALPSHSGEEPLAPRERGQCWCHVNTTRLAASHSPGPGQGARLETQARLHREQHPGCTCSSPLLKAGWHRRPGTEHQQFPTARQEHHGHRHGTGHAGHPPAAITPRTPARRNGSAQHRMASPPPAASAGTPQLGGSCQCRTRTVEWGEPCRGTEPSHHPLSLSSSVDDTQVTDTTQPNPGQLAQS